ncbi:hypothetical protein KSX_54300 [Ktedonospora formicarum]|uniref:HNH nuclease domain-containing protein n=1 Tax=Ktedonospora formicarum TaxID=2778364 RepID=A0A8J3HZS5_9CHLR|nr:hypothetical protein KSX_54300 [Ktedonospora formicarum]
MLSSGKAAVYRRYPFTIVLKRVVEKPEVQPLRLKLDPGSKTTGIALVNDANDKVIFAAELSHRGQTIKASLDRRRALRRGRRQRKTRYRKSRWQNRRRKPGWLPTSLESRLANILTWVRRLCQYASIVALSQELVKFDPQLLDNPDIAGIEYQQGKLAGYEVRAFLLEKWNRTCAYCGKQDIPLQVEHIQARANGGTNRASNLTLACQPCNKAKDTFPIEVFLANKPEVLTRLLAQAKRPLKDAAAVNATRYALLERLQAVGLPVECGTGGLTKYNRTQRGLPKSHWLDAACVGKRTPEVLHVKGVVPLLMTATGHGSRQMCRVDRYGFPRGRAKQAKKVSGFQTGDMIKAVVTSGKKVGTYVGRVAVRSTGSFNLTTEQGTIQGIRSRFCQPVHRSDGYGYRYGASFPLPQEGTPLSSPRLKGQGAPEAEVR